VSEALLIDPLALGVTDIGTVPEVVMLMTEPSSASIVVLAESVDADAATGANSTTAKEAVIAVTLFFLINFLILANPFYFFA
jgi:hypothetical protein